MRRRPELDAPVMELLSLFLLGSGGVEIAIPIHVVTRAVEAGLVEKTDQWIMVTPAGKRYFKRGIQ